MTTNLLNLLNLLRTTKKRLGRKNVVLEMVRKFLMKKLTTMKIGEILSTSQRKECFMNMTIA